ncbi:hypothetical protein [Flavobacterium sp. WC2509]|uniref:hypothetical protein n=1 Tax=Flavobacterium sp. WC2509 TaxID=3461406 RepID=UPI00404413F5
MSNMTLTERTLNHIKFLESQNKLMIKLATPKGFYELYNIELQKYGSPDLAFRICNVEYRRLFDTYRYDSFESFLVDIKKNLSVSQLKMSPKDVLEREFLLAWFKQCGFDTWTSFKAVVLHYFPEVTEVKLLAFWQNTAIEAQVLIRVNHVKQILG